MEQRLGWFRETLRVIAPIAIVAVGIGGYMVLSAQREVPVRAADETEAPLVETVSVTQHSGEMDIEVDGTVVPYRDVTVSAEVPGRIAKKADICRAGRYVTQGTLLFEIDPRDYSLEVQRLANEVQQAVHQIEELDVEIANTESLIELAQEDLELQQRDLERIEDLANRNVLTESDLDDAKRLELAARNTLKTLNNQLALLTARKNRLEQAKLLKEIQLEKAQLDQARTKISAPIDGMIVEDMVEQDSYVQPGAALVKIEDTSRAEILCNLESRDIYWLWHDTQTGGDQSSEAVAQSTGASTPAPIDDLPNTYRLPPVPVTVLYEAGGQRFAWDGRLSRYEGTGIDQQTRTVPCRVVVDDPRQWRPWKESQSVSGAPGALRRGMFVTVIVHVRPDTEILTVPRQAIRPGSVVWTVEDDQLRVRPVQVADVDDQQALVHAPASGIRAGDHVVLSPVAFAHDGMAVREEHTE